jgi:hypothetical protein
MERSQRTMEKKAGEREKYWKAVETGAGAIRELYGSVPPGQRVLLTVVPVVAWWVLFQIFFALLDRGWNPWAW